MDKNVQKIYILQGIMNGLKKNQWLFKNTKKYKSIN